LDLHPLTAAFNFQEQTADVLLLSQSCSNYNLGTRTNFPDF